MRRSGYNFGVSVEQPSLEPPGLPRWVFAILVGVAAFLLPWTLWLTLSLPSRHVSEHWDAAWVGFDVGEIAAFLLAAYAAWRRAAWLQGAAAAAGTMLLCDAWFDVLLSTGDEKVWIAVGQAVFSEIPLALLCFWIAWDTARFWRQWERVTSRGGRPARDPA